MTRTGSCLCGDITYEITGDALATAVCHCEHCQRQSGGAFSTNLVVQADQMTVNGDLKVYEDRGRTGDGVYVLRKFCSNCGSPIVSELMEPANILAVKVGTLDERADINPQIQVWCDDKQPWIELAGIAAKDQE